MHAPSKPSRTSFTKNKQTFFKRSTKADFIPVFSSPRFSSSSFKSITLKSVNFLPITLASPVDAILHKLQFWIPNSFLDSTADDVLNNFLWMNFAHIIYVAHIYPTRNRTLQISKSTTWKLIAGTILLTIYRYKFQNNTTAF